MSTTEPDREPEAGEAEDVFGDDRAGAGEVEAGRTTA
jgi:hypothetical protein